MELAGGLGLVCWGWDRLEHIVCLDGFVNTKGLLHTVWLTDSSGCVCVCLFVSVLRRVWLIIFEISKKHDEV